MIKNVIKSKNLSYLSEFCVSWRAYERCGSPKKFLTNKGRFRFNLSCFANHDDEEEFMATPVTVPMVGKIVSVSVKVGDKVKEDDQVAVLEAMKMEMPLVAPVSGTVKEVRVSAGQEVEAEAVVAVIE